MPISWAIGGTFASGWLEWMNFLDSLIDDLLEHGHLVITWLSIMMTLISMMSPLQLAAVTNELMSRQINMSVQKNRGLY